MLENDFSFNRISCHLSYRQMEFQNTRERDKALRMAVILKEFLSVKPRAPSKGYFHICNREEKNRLENKARN